MWNANLTAIEWFDKMLYLLIVFVISEVALERRNLQMYPQT